MLKPPLAPIEEATVTSRAAALRSPPEASPALNQDLEKQVSQDNGARDADPREEVPLRLIGRLRALIAKAQPDERLRDAIEEYIEESAKITDSDSGHERALISNVMTLRDMTVVDVMIPRADIVALNISATSKELLDLLAERQFSRVPVYRDTLDHMIGTIHIKDVLAAMARGEELSVENLVRDVPIVSPAMQVLDLILMMKEKRKHMVYVVDEYGGIDGLVTIGDVIEAIIGEVDDEHAREDVNPQLVKLEDGTFIADGRVDLEEFEKICASCLSEEQREDNDTLGGLIFALAGRVPGRGEIITHPSGLVFEILEADPRRVNRVMIRTPAAAAD